LILYRPGLLQLQSELVASKTLVQRLESEVETLKSNWDKEHRNMDAMVTARDRANGEKQKLVDEINRIRAEHLKTVRFRTHSSHLVSALKHYNLCNGLHALYALV